MRLTVERLFADPPLSGTLPAQLKFAPGGEYVAYLRVADDDRERTDLWRLDLASGEARCWLNGLAPASGGGNGEPTAAEKAARERQRSFSRGITAYAFSPDGSKVLVPHEGAGFLLHTEDGRLERFTSEHTRQTDFRFSPKGTRISYVRDGNLLCYELASGTETPLTRDGSELVSNGLADFIAQEEMHRFDGHWWSPDERWVAYTRVDESTVELSQRYEIDADRFQVVPQRYPYAGARNAEVELWVREIATGHTRRLDYALADDDYLARVSWAGDELAVQSQSRDQRRLTLSFLAPESGARRDVLEERAETWIELHDNFKHLARDRYLWTSDRSGSSHLYLAEGPALAPITRGPGRVNRVLHASANQVLFTGWLETPTEEHLYAARLTGGAGPERLTPEPGWHEVVLDSGGTRFIDRYTALDRPGRVQVVSLADAGRIQLAEETVHETHPYQPFLPAHRTPRLGTLTAADGQALHYRLTEPGDGRGRGAALVYVYGGPGVQRVRNEWAPLLLQLLSQRGYGVLELDNRGGGNRERAFVDPIHRQLGKVEVDDQVVGARFLQGLDWVDAERIGVFGHSYGGYMTLMCLARAPEVFKAGTAIAPVSDWSLYDTHYTERYLGTPAGNTEGYRQSSVLSHLDGFAGRLLLIHGMADDNVLFTHSTRLYKALQDRGIQFEMMAYPGSKHALQERSVSVHRFSLMLDFFDRHL